MHQILGPPFELEKDGPVFSRTVLVFSKLPSRELLRASRVNGSDVRTPVDSIGLQKPEMTSLCRVVRLDLRL